MPLPAGAPTRVQVRIRDAFGSVATAQLSIAVANVDTSSASVVSAISAYELGLLSQAVGSGSIDQAAQVWWAHFDGCIGVWFDVLQKSACLLEGLF
jgi:hypothetical protein